MFSFADCGMCQKTLLMKLSESMQSCTWSPLPLMWLHKPSTSASLSFLVLMTHASPNVFSNCLGEWENWLVFKIVPNTTLKIYSWMCTIQMCQIFLDSIQMLWQQLRDYQHFMWQDAPQKVLKKNDQKCIKTWQKHRTKLWMKKWIQMLFPSANRILFNATDCTCSH